MLRTHSTDWQRWHQYFEQNATQLMTIDWHEPYQLTSIELDGVKKSIQQFQLGESSEGQRLLGQAQWYSASHNDPDYVPALRLFINEEHRHASYLARFLE